MKMDHLGQCICDMDVSIDVKLDLNFGGFFQDLTGSPETMCIRLPLSFKFRIHPQCCGIYTFSYFRRRFSQHFEVLT